MSTVVRTEKRQRTVVGQLIKWAFIAFNILMLAWLVSGMGAVANLHPTSEAARVGHAIGATLGFSMILGIWMMGDVILGLLVLLTRGDKVIVEELPTGGYTGGSFGKEASESAVDIDAMVARYIQGQQATAQGRELSSPGQKAFGRRH